ncbi:MAG: SUMF1/EgtB/PvdO family nonheme iron enzyme [Planctomycetota bacterium]
MNRISCSAVTSLLVTMSLVSLTSSCQAQRSSARADKPARAEASTNEVGQRDGQPALPANLLPVPAGEVTLGTEAKVLVEQLELIHDENEEKIASDLRRTMSELGGEQVFVEEFFLGEHPVTNTEYKRFIEATGRRWPSHWWDEPGADKPEEARELYDKIQEWGADLPAKERKTAYWRAHWQELPWKIPTTRVGRTEVSMDDYPVVYVSWADASAYARWVGMRLPDEAEWLRAAVGDGNNPYVWGEDPNGHGLKSRNAQTDRLFEVGHFRDFATGPFGHTDMVLGVWEWTGNLGFAALPAGSDYDRRRKQLLGSFKPRDRELRNRLATFFPEFRNDRVALKGGFYASVGVELRPQTRAYAASSQTTSAVGFRVAKTAIPGRDAAISAFRLNYDRSFWPQGVRPNIADQIGIERYQFEDSERKQIKSYDSVSFVPVNFVTTDQKLKKLADLLKFTIEENSPVVLGTLVVSIPIAEPALEPGIYTVCYRAAGAPKNFQRDVTKAAEAFASGRELTDEDTFIGRLARFGIRQAEVEEGPVNYVRFAKGELRVPFDVGRFILRNADGDYVHHWPAGSQIEVKSGYEDGDATVKVDAESDGTETVQIDFGVRQTDRSKKKVYKVRLELTLGAEQAGGDNWVLPKTE